MYERFVARLGPSVANILYGFWYALILLIIVIFGSTPETTLRYLQL